MLEWWNGRHEGLKILWSLRPCGFESRFEHHMKTQASNIVVMFGFYISGASGFFQTFRKITIFRYFPYDIFCRNLQPVNFICRL